jgi:hypothetical protein
MAILLDLHEIFYLLHGFEFIFYRYQVDLESM